MAEKEYIEREAAIADIAMMAEDRRIPVDSYGGKIVGEVISILRRIPAADVRPVVRGEWKPGDMPTYGGYKCSVCGGNTVHYKANFCPNCGAEMKGESSDV